MGEQHERASAVAHQIEAELVRLGRWSGIPVDPERLVNMGPFGHKTLAPEEWIQFVLLARLRAVVAANGEFPTTSELGVWATRQFDGDRDSARLVTLLHHLDELVQGHPTGTAALLAAAVRGDVARVRGMLDRGTDPDSQGPTGVTALHVAAAAGHPALASLLATPFEVEVQAIVFDAPSADYAGLARLLLTRGADKDVRSEAGGLTPLMVATYFGYQEAIAILRAVGADEYVRDAWGRTAERLAVFQTIARAIAVCRGLPMVRAAYVAQVHAPMGHQYTTPVLGLELTAQLPADVFASWRAEHPMVAFVLAEDAVSQLVRLCPPVYERPVVEPASSAAGSEYDLSDPHFRGG